MPPKNVRRRTPVYVYDEEDRSFRSIGVLDNGDLVTDLAEMTDFNYVETDKIFDLAEVKVHLKLRLIDRIKLMKILKFGSNEGFFERAKDAILCSFAGLKYQFLHIFKRKKRS